jgi:hypothetical protein
LHRRVVSGVSGVGSILFFLARFMVSNKIRASPVKKYEIRVAARALYRL